PKGGRFVALPPIPVPGMENRNRQGDARDWAAFGTDILCTFLALLGPIFMGVLERALRDGAAAAQREELDRRDAQKRGGTGGPRPQDGGAAQERVVVVSLEDLPEGDEPA